MLLDIQEKFQSEPALNLMEDNPTTQFKATGNQDFSFLSDRVTEHTAVFLDLLGSHFCSSSQGSQAQHQ